MAQIKGIFEGISGKIGDIVFARRGDKTFIKRRPSKPKNPPSQQILERRLIFGLTGKISAVISTIKEIKHFWKKDDLSNQTAYNKIFKANYRKLDIKDLAGNIVFSPYDGFEVKNTYIKIQEDGLWIECTAVIKNKLIQSRDCLIAGAIILKNPLENFLPEYEVLGFRTAKKIMDNSGKVFQVIKFKEQDLCKFQLYTDKRTFAALITLDLLEQPIEISRTIKSKL